MCGCKNSKTYNVRLPDGKVVAYGSEIAAKAKVKSTPGATLAAPVPRASV